LLDSTPSTGIISEVKCSFQPDSSTFTSSTTNSSTTALVTGNYDSKCVMDVI